MIATGYYGGKFSHLADILPRLPETHIYVEPFAGSGSVLLNRHPSPIEVFNDLNKDLVNFFQVLRGEQGERLLELIALTPYSREEFRIACGNLKRYNKLERARLWYVRIAQSRNSLPLAIPSNWSFATQHDRRDMAGTTSKWLNRTPQLMDVMSRLLPVQIECDDALAVIPRYDEERTLFYVDPPYVAKTRKTKKVYAHEMSDTQHRELSHVLHLCKGRVALSGYAGELYDDLFADWHRIDFAEQFISSASKSRSAVEVLWTNYDTDAVMKAEQERKNGLQLQLALGME